MDGARARIENERDHQRWLAWHIAALPLTKKFPTLDKFIGRKPRRQTPEEMMQIAHMWNAAVKAESGK